MAAESPQNKESVIPGIVLLAVSAFLLWAAGPGRDTIAAFMVNHTR